MWRGWGAFLGVALVVVAGVVLPVRSAAACSCPGDVSVTESVEDAEAVYVARPRLPDLLPGRSFRVLRTLEGPPRTTIRAEVLRWGGGAACATRVSVFDEPRIFTASEDGGKRTISSCSQLLRGETAVAEAREVTGAGTPVPWRPDVVHVAQWLGLAAVAVLVARRRWGRR